MGNYESCIETVKVGCIYQIQDATARNKGPLAVLDETEYVKRINAVGETGDSRHLFGEVALALTVEGFLSATGLTAEDLSAHAHYVRQGQLDELPDGGCFTAFADRRPTEVRMTPEIADNIVLGYN